MKVLRTKNTELWKNIGRMRDGSVSVGFFKDTEPYQDGQPVAQVAYFNEFGRTMKNGERQPPRSFMRSTLHAKENEWKAKCAELIKIGMPAEKIMEQMGNIIKGDIQATIQRIAAAGGNRPSTIRKKGFDSPLIDTAHMMKTVGYKVGATV
jgi:hypothetical protein